MDKLNEMYEAVQELVCAFVVNQAAVDKAKRQKKSMLKVYQDRDIDLDLAFRECLATCQRILEE
jgi:hypothetical protein